MSFVEDTGARMRGKLGFTVLDEIVEAAIQAGSPEEYEAAVVQWLERHVGCDTFYLGAAVPSPPLRPVVAGVAPAYVARCESESARYWPDRLALNDAALTRGGVAEDCDVLSTRERDARPFYREVVAGLGIRAIAVCVLRFRDEPVASMYLGRTSRGATFQRQLPILERALPALSLGHVAQRTRAPVVLEERPRLTPRERDVLGYVARGFTNAEIALALGTTTNTVKKQIASLLDKCNVANRTELVARFRSCAD